MTAGVRDARPDDHAALIAHGLTPQSVARGQLQIVVATAGARNGYATFLHGDKNRGALPVLYVVETRTRNLRLFWQLIDRVAERMIEAGFNEGHCVVREGDALTASRRDTQLTFEPVGRNVTTGNPAYFTTHVPDLAAFRRSIARFV